LLSQIKNKDRHREVHAKLKREKKAQKRALDRERGQATCRAEELGEQASQRSSNCPLHL
jgi:ribosome production factor 1